MSRLVEDVRTMLLVMCNSLLIFLSMTEFRRSTDCKDNNRGLVNNSKWTYIVDARMGKDYHRA